MVPATYKTGLFTEKGRIKTKKPKKSKEEYVYKKAVCFCFWMVHNYYMAIYVLYMYCNTTT